MSSQPRSNNGDDSIEIRRTILDDIPVAQHALWTADHDLIFSNVRRHVRAGRDNGTSRNMHARFYNCAAPIQTASSSTTGGPLGRPMCVSDAIWQCAAIVAVAILQRKPMKTLSWMIERVMDVPRLIQLPDPIVEFEEMIVSVSINGNDSPNFS
ncbi:hypothetical protein PQR07_37110 [Paraburkholderia aspalathi]|uniref:hypothetical protein n=1 Tax=Paraburkholderia aspalathi TaxID=1324617 RepID=UPI0038BB6F25